jgi:hypothetical protein
MRQSGFTLIEAMVTGVLSVMIAGVVLALLRTNNAHLADGLARSRLLELHDALTAEIGRLGRQAWIVKVDGDPLGLAPFDTTAAVPPDRKSVVFCNRAGDSLGGFRILEEGGLEELVIDPESPPARLWKPLSFGPETVRLDAEASGFDVLTRRRGITYVLSMQSAEGEVSLQPVSETVLTRNGWAYK